MLHPFEEVDQERVPQLTDRQLLDGVCREQAQIAEKGFDGMLRFAVGAQMIGEEIECSRQCRSAVDVISAKRLAGKKRALALHEARSEFIVCASRRGCQSARALRILRARSRRVKAAPT